MVNNIEKLLEESRRVKMTDSQRNEQRVSFAYGTANIENADVTRSMVEKAAKKIRYQGNER